MFIDGATAFALFEEAAALGNEEAIFLAGYMLDWCYDYSGQRDYEKAREYYEMIEDRNPYAMISLGYLYLKGRGVEADTARADEYFRKAVELIDENETGNLKYSNVAYYMIGHLYHDGKGVEQDYLIAKEWYEKAAELGNAYAMYNIGTLYYYGEGVEQDYQLAKEWFQRAADLGNEEAQRYLDTYY